MQSALAEGCDAPILPGMEWRDQGTLLTVRSHGESAAIIEVLTAGHGRHAGVVPGGASRRIAPILQPGTQLDLTWRARLDAHIGTYTVEPIRSRASILSDRKALAALNAVCALLHMSIPEREPHPSLYGTTVALLDRFADGSNWDLDYLGWELTLLDDLGYGLDLSSCAVTGATDGLVYVSPASGRAVSAAGAGDWAERLLPLPSCLTGGGVTRESITDGLVLTGHFLKRFAQEHGHHDCPDARIRLAELMQRDR